MAVAARLCVCDEERIVDRQISGEEFLMTRHRVKSAAGRMAAIAVLAAFGSAGANAAPQKASSQLKGPPQVGVQSDYRPSVSRIAFARSRRIYVIHADGSGLKRLLLRANVKPTCEGEGICSKSIAWWSPAWSPKGNRLAVIGTFDNGTLDGDTRVYVRETSGHTRAVFSSDVGTSGVSWSPDGAWLAHDTGRDFPELILIRVRTGKAHRVGKGVSGFNATWSPNAHSFAFHYERPDENGVGIVASDGTNFKALTQSGDDPDWSPDGMTIAFASNGIRTVDLDGHEVRLTSAGGNPSWSTDGSHIVFERGNDLWIMDSTGSHQHLLVRNGRAPDWSP